MKILEITLTVTDLAASAAFYREVLGLQVDEKTDGAVVYAGSTRLTLLRGERFDGVHHMAFGVVPAEFELAHAWLAERVSLLVSDGSEVIIGSPSWRSRSLYFLGPDDIVLELIARDADEAESPGNGHYPRVLSISEIGVAVPDVAASVHTLSRELGLTLFSPASPSFAPVGDDDGLLIVVQQNRIWFPTGWLRASHGTLDIQILLPAPHRRLSVTPEVFIATDQASPGVDDRTGHGVVLVTDHLCQTGATPQPPTGQPAANLTAHPYRRPAKSTRR